MAHFILEYSANLDEDLDIPGLFRKLTDAAIATEIFPLAGIRCRAHRCEHYSVANGNPEFGFIHLQVKMGTGRTKQQKQKASAALFDALRMHLDPVYEHHGLALSFEMTELPEVFKFNQNNLRDYLASA